MNNRMKRFFSVLSIILMLGTGFSVINFNEADNSNNIDISENGLAINPSISEPICIEDIQPSNAGDVGLRSTRSELQDGGMVGNTGFEPYYYYIGGMVNAANGNLFLSETDISIKARGFDIEIIRSYNSHLSGYHGPFGFGWTHNYNMKLLEQPNGSMVFFDGDGSIHAFSDAGNGDYHPPVGLFAKLRKLLDESFELRDKSGMLYAFDMNGVLDRIVDRNGNQLTFTYSNGLLNRVSDDSGLYLTLDYDSAGRIITITDPIERTVTYKYSLSDLIQVTDPMGNPSLYSYFENHLLLSMVDRMDIVTLISYESGISIDRAMTIELAKYDRSNGTHSSPITPFILRYDDENNILHINDIQGNENTVRMNEFGNPTVLTDSMGNPVKMSWKDNDLRGYTDKNGNTYRYYYDDFGNIIGTTDPSGNYRSYEWNHIDSDARFISLLTRMTNERGKSTRFEYDDDGNLLTVTDVNSNSTQLSYDDYGFIEEIVTPGGITSTIGYDDHGNIESVTDSGEHEIRFEHDAVGRMTSLTDVFDKSYAYDYNENGWITMITDPLDHEITFSYDASGALIASTDANGYTTRRIAEGEDTVIDALGGKTSRFYDDRGNVIRIQNPRGMNTTYEYDILDRVISTTDALGNTEYYGYDAIGNMISITDRNGNIIHQDYDELNRLIEIRGPSVETTTLVWSTTGNLLSEESEDGTITYTYDALDRITSVTFDYGTFTRTVEYSYDEDGNIVAMTESDSGATSYTYDELGRLESITDPSGDTFVFDYDAMGRRSTMEYPNDITASYVYDDVGNVKKVSYEDSDGAFIEELTYTHDAMHNVLSRDRSDELTEYTYDEVYRLVEVDPDDDDTTTYSYDENDNRLTATRGAEETDYEYDDLDRLLSDGSANYNYDDNGNLIRKSNDDGTTWYHYDHLDRLAAVNLPDETEVEYRYFPNGNRMSKSVDGETTYYLYDQEDILCELDESGNEHARYTHGPGIDEPLSIDRDDTQAYYLHDALGSVLSLFDDSENELAEYRYDAFGILNIISETIKNPYTYTGREYEKETEMYYYRARYYTPDVGRFTSRDPVVQMDTSPYVYVDNNPLSKIDPSGKFAPLLIAIPPTVKALGGAALALGLAAYMGWGIGSAFEELEDIIDQAIKQGEVREELYDRIIYGMMTDQDLTDYQQNLQALLSDAVKGSLNAYKSFPLTAMSGTVSSSVTDVFTDSIKAQIFDPDRHNKYDKQRFIDGTDRQMWVDNDNCIVSFNPDDPDYDTIQMNGQQVQQLQKLQQAIQKKDKKKALKVLIQLYNNPGGTNPDDNHDVSILNSGLDASKQSHRPGARIAILSTGFSSSLSDLLSTFNESTALVEPDIPLEELNNYPVFIIPSGGLYGLDSLPSFREKLDAYVDSGGTLIAFSQSNGYEFEALPGGEVTGYGWLEDHHCQHASIGMSAYHPILSGQDSSMSDANVDGYFTGYPNDATILLSRTKNSMPAMLMYEHGNGTVLATTIYTDWAYSNYAATEDGMNLVRDVISWAKSKDTIHEYGPGDDIDISINITSHVGVGTDQIVFKVIDPDNTVIDTVSVDSSIPPFGEDSIQFIYTAPSTYGIWHIDYTLVNYTLGEVQYVEDAGRFSISAYAGDKNGWIYRGNDISYSVNSDAEHYPRGSNGTFTISVWNHKETERTVKCYWAFPHNLWKTWDRDLYGFYWGNSKLKSSTLYETINVQGNSEATIVYTVPLFAPIDNIKVAFYEIIDSSQIYLGETFQGIFTHEPVMTLESDIDRDEYKRGDTIALSLNITNSESVSVVADIAIIIRGPDREIFRDRWEVTLDASKKRFENVELTIPSDWEFGTYSLRAYVYAPSIRAAIDHSVGYFKVAKEAYDVEIEFDQANGIYAVGENMTVFMNATNLEEHISWFSTLNLSIPILDFYVSEVVSLEPGETANFVYPFTIPGNISAYSYTAFVRISTDDSVVSERFHVPESNLVLMLNTLKYDAGDDIIFMLTNAGGIDTRYEGSVQLLDTLGFQIFEEIVIQDIILAGETRTFDFETPGQIVDGEYFFLASFKDMKTGKDTGFMQSLDMGGLNSNITSVTNRVIYFNNDEVSIFTNLTNLARAINNGTLDLKIYRSYIGAEGSGPKTLGSEQNVSTNTISYEDEKIITSLFDLSSAGYSDTYSHDEMNDLDSSEYFDSPTPDRVVDLFQNNDHMICSTGSENEDDEIVIEGETVWEDEIRILNKTLIINSTGKLTLINTTLIINCTIDGEFHIEVRSGGEMYVLNGSNITSMDTEHEYYFQVLADSIFKMKDSELHECGYSNEKPGLQIFADETLIENSIFSYNYCGIIFEDSSNNTIVGCKAYGNEYGMVVEHTNNITFSLCNVSSNSEDGFYVYWSNGTKIIQSIINSNGDDGIQLIRSDQTEIVGCTMVNNDSDGVEMERSDHNTVNGCDANDNEDDGFDIYKSHFTNLVDCESTGNKDDGFNLYESDFVNLLRSNASYNGIGIYQYNSSFSTITNCIAFSNDNSGFHLLESLSSNLLNCTAYDNDDGLYLNGSSLINITDCTLHDNDDGIDIEISHTNTISGTTITSNDDDGVDFENSYENAISNCTITENDDDGIILINSHRNELTICTFVSNGNDGIDLETSHDNIINGSTIHSNDDDGITLDGSGNNTISSCEVYSNSNNGILLDHSSDNNDIYLCDVNSNDFRGLRLDESDFNTIIDCAVADNPNIGLNLHDSHNNEISRCNVESNYYGIILYGSDDNRIANCDAMNNGDSGIFMYLSSDRNIIVNCTSNFNEKNGFKVQESNGTSIMNCSARENDINGILLHEAEDNTISHCKVTQNNQDGIEFYYSGSNEVIDSKFENNIRNGVNLYRSESNLIYNNYFYNGVNVYDNGNNSWNVSRASGTNILGGPWLGGNYWSDYEGRDVNEDGLGDTETPYNSSGNIAFGGDLAPLVMGRLIWEREVPFDLAENETLNDIFTVLPDVFNGYTGKFELVTTVQNVLGQEIAQTKLNFYRFESNTSLIVDTNKTIYKPGESVGVSGLVTNHGDLTKTYELFVKQDGSKLFNDSFSLDPDEMYEFEINTSAIETFILEVTIDDVNVTEIIPVESPSIDIGIVAPNIVDSKPFDVDILIENTGNISADLTVVLNPIWNITIPAGESRLIRTDMSITEDTTVNVTVSGDVDRIIRKEILHGEEVRANFTLQPTYMDGVVEIPYSLANVGSLDITFNATFIIDSDEDQTIFKDIYMPVGENATGLLLFNLSKGEHELTFISPYEILKIQIHVMSPPDLTVTSILPIHKNFTAGENVTLTFVVENIGGTMGEAEIRLLMPDFEDTNRTWIEPGKKDELNFTFWVPDDLEERNYTAVYELNGIRFDFSYFVNGMKISVNSSLDKYLYVENETATFTLDVTNECEFNMSLYARVKLDDYDIIKPFNLTDSKSMQFDIPVIFNGQKMFYGIYMDSGRALYLNGLYINKKEMISLSTDKQVYNMGDTVNIIIESETPCDLNIMAPGYNANVSVNGELSLNFSVPELSSGQYHIQYVCNNQTFSYPFDVIGLHARIIECSLDKYIYGSTDIVNASMTIEANRDMYGEVRLSMYDSRYILIDEAVINISLKEGVNRYVFSRPFSTNHSGIQLITYEIYAHSDPIFLASGAEYFDVVDDQPPVVTLLSPSGGESLSGTITIDWEVEDNFANELETTIEFSDDEGSTWYTLVTDLRGSDSYRWDTTTVLNGTGFQIRVTAIDSSGNSHSELSQDSFSIENVPQIIDNIPPYVSIEFPLIQSILNGTVMIMGTAMDIDGSIQAVEMKIDDGYWIVANGTSSWNFNWNTSMTSNGVHMISARSYDGSDYSPMISLNYSIDNTHINLPPSVVIISPLNNVVIIENVNTIHVKGNSLDDDEVLHVEFKIDNGRWYNANGTDNWNFNVSIINITEGNHTISVRSYDGSQYSSVVSISITISPDIDTSKEPDDDGFNKFHVISIMIIIFLIIGYLISFKRNQSNAKLKKAKTEEKDIVGKEMKDVGENEKMDDVGEERTQVNRKDATEMEQENNGIEDEKEESNEGVRDPDADF